VNFHPVTQKRDKWERRVRESQYSLSFVSKEKNHVIFFFADCLCPVVKIVIVKESGEKKEIEVEDVNSNANKVTNLHLPIKIML